MATHLRPKTHDDWPQMWCRVGGVWHVADRLAQERAGPIPGYCEAVLACGLGIEELDGDYACTLGDVLIANGYEMRIRRNRRCRRCVAELVSRERTRRELAGY
jgi:hypothetical protein